MKSARYDPREHERQKQRSRDSDAADLAADRVSAHDLQSANSAMKGCAPGAGKVLSWEADS